MNINIKYEINIQFNAITYHVNMTSLQLTGETVQNNITRRRPTAYNVHENGNYIQPVSYTIPVVYL